MNILLIHPQMSQNNLQKKTMPMGLAYLAAYCRSKHPAAHVEIYDAHALDAGMDQVFAKIRERPWDVIGCTAWTLQMPAAEYILKGARRIHPKAVIVLGGTHATMMRQQPEFSFCDYVFIGESEHTFADLIADGCKRNDEPQYVEAENFIEDLDSLPFPAWDLLPMEKYAFPLHVARIPRIPVIGSRGCPYNCSFCSSPRIWRRVVRYRSAENVVAEILEAQKRYGYKGVHFWDDNFLEDPDRAAALCRELIRKRAGIRWVALTRSSLINRHKDLLPDLKAAGCIALEIGLEAFDDSIYKNVRKGEKRNDILAAVANLKKVGIVPLFTFMTFMPGETLTTARNLSRFFEEIMPETRRIQKGGVGDWPICVGQFTTPHVGTRFAEQAKETGVPLARDYGDYHHHNINWLPKSFLDDVPVRTRKAVGPHALDKIERKKPMLFAEFGNNGRADSELRSLAEMVLSRVDGIKSVRQIIEDVISHTGKERNRAYRLGAFVTLCMAQMEIIRSAQEA